MSIIYIFNIYIFDHYLCYLELPNVKARKNFKHYLIHHSNFLPKYYVYKLDLMLHKLLSNMCVSHSVMSDSSWGAVHQAFLSMESCRKEHWSGLPFPSLL